MPKERSDFLFQLVKSMSKTEKRYFKLFAGNNESKSSDKKFIRLFDLLDKQDEFNDESILKLEPSLKPTQLSNLKAHLYKRILQSIRQYHMSKLEAVEIREMIDYIEILFKRRLYEQSLDVLKKAKKKATRGEHLELLLELYRWEKDILMNTLDKNNQERVNRIIEEVVVVNERINNINRFTNLNAKLNALYLKIGFVKNKEDYELAEGMMHEWTSSIQEDRLSQNEKLYLYELFVGYYSFIQRPSLGYQYAKKWVDIYDRDKHLMNKNIEHYIKGLNQLMNSQYRLMKYQELVDTRKKLKKVGRVYKANMNENIKTRIFKYSYVHEFNRLFMIGDFKKGIDRFNRIKEHIDMFALSLDIHSRLILYYKIACLYFGNESYRESVFWLNKIINAEDVEMDVREDVHSFARIVSLICHYEIGNNDLIDYYVRSTFRFLLRKGDLYLFQRNILQFLKKLGRGITQDNIIHEFEDLRNKLIPLTKDPYEKRPFIYFDIISWLDSKITNRSIQEIVEEKARKIIGDEFPK